MDGIPRLMDALKNDVDIAIKGSAAGTFQNISRETASRLSLQHLGAVEPLVRLLRVSDIQAQICAAGALLLS